MPNPPTVLFVCQHGAAKSVVAAEHLRRLAAARGHTLNTVAAGVDPDESIPPHVFTGLREDGLDLDTDRRPVPVSREQVERADYVVSFGCDLTGLAGAAEHIENWGDVPAVSDGYETARSAIVAKLESLLDKLDAEPRASGDNSAA